MKSLPNGNNEAQPASGSHRITTTTPSQSQWGVDEEFKQYLTTQRHRRYERHNQEYTTEGEEEGSYTTAGRLERLEHDLVNHSRKSDAMNSSSQGTANSLAPRRGREISRGPVEGLQQIASSDDTAPVPPAQLDANMHIEEKLGSAPPHDIQVTVVCEDAVRQVEPVPIYDDESIRPVVHGSAEENEPRESHPTSINVSDSSGSDEESDQTEDLVQATATLVGNEGVAVAEPLHFYEDKKWRICALGMCILLTGLAVFLTLTLTDVVSINEGEDKEVEVNAGQAHNVEALVTSETPSLSPSLSPTFDPRPTLEIVQDRGFLICGMDGPAVDDREGYTVDLCRAVAAVIVGNPDRYKGVQVSFANRWQHLHGRKIDVLVRQDTHTVEREVKEPSTGVGFTFSSVFNYDGMVYLGSETFVKCAEEQKRYDECSSLLVGVVAATTHYDFLKTAFPSDYLKVGSSLEVIQEMLLNGTCNVIAYEKSVFLDFVASINGSWGENLTVGTKMKTKEPLAMVTRNNDREFSDTVNWILQALFFGEEQNLTKGSSPCRDYSDEVASYDASDLIFMNAVYCVGNFGEIFGGGPESRGMNQINNGTGMLYAIPFGNIDKENIIVPPAGDTMAKIRKDGVLNCGVVYPERTNGGIMEDEGLVHNMDVEYCKTLSAAMLNGDPKDVNFVNFEDDDLSRAYIALHNGEVDVLVGSIIQQKYDFQHSSSRRGFYFSTPYYYGNQASSNEVRFYSIATREDDVLFVSFINCIVLATIYAQENGIERDKSGEMPIVSIFGSDLNWSLRDAIAYSGGYDQIYEKKFGSNISEAFRGRNTLTKGGPLMHSFAHP